MKFYKDDFNQDLLHAQLETFSVHYQSTQNPQQKQITIFDIKRYSFLCPQHNCLKYKSHACNELNFRKIFRGLRRIKTSLRATMLQERLNHLMLLHVHKKRTDTLDAKTGLNDFIKNSEHRLNIFAKLQ